MRVGGRPARPGVAKVRERAWRQRVEGAASLDPQVRKLGIDGCRSGRRVDGGVATIAVEVFLPGGSDDARVRIETAHRAVVLRAPEEGAGVERRPRVELDGPQRGIAIAPVGWVAG